MMQNTTNHVFDRLKAFYVTITMCGMTKIILEMMNIDYSNIFFTSHIGATTIAVTIAPAT